MDRTDLYRIIARENRDRKLKRFGFGALVAAIFFTLVFFACTTPDAHVVVINAETMPSGFTPEELDCYRQFTAQRRGPIDGTIKIGGGPTQSWR